MSFGSTEVCMEKVCGTEPGDSEAHDSAAKTDDVHVIIFNALSGRIVVPADSRSSPGYFVCGNGCAYTAATQENSTIDNSARNRASQWNREIRVVIIAVIGGVSEVDYLVVLVVQELYEFLFHFKSAVISSYTYSQLLPPCLVICSFAAATIASALNPNLFINRFNGAEAPKVSIQTLWPSEPVYLHQPKSDAISTETRALTCGGNTLLVIVVLPIEEFP